MDMRTRSIQLSIASDVIMILLSLVSGYLLYLDVTTTLTPEQIAQHNSIDMAIAYIFLIDFFVLLYISSDRKKFIKTRWWELLAAIPITTESTQILRLLRLFRIVRVLRIGLHIDAIREDMKDGIR